MAATILEYAGESGADLIAMASHGHGWGQLILGDVADEVVRRSAVPNFHYPSAGSLTASSVCDEGGAA